MKKVNVSTYVTVQEHERLQQAAQYCNVSLASFVAHVAVKAAGLRLELPPLPTVPNKQAKPRTKVERAMVDAAERGELRNGKGEKINFDGTPYAGASATLAAVALPDYERVLNDPDASPEAIEQAIRERLALAASTSNNPINASDHPATFDPDEAERLFAEAMDQAGIEYPRTPKS